MKKKELKQGTKAYNNMLTTILNAKQNLNNYDLSRCYKRPSTNKWNIYLHLCDENKRAERSFITSFNAHYFTICFEYENYYKVYTYCNVYILKKKGGEK